MAPLVIRLKQSFLKRWPELRFFDEVPAQVQVNFLLAQVWLLGGRLRATGVRLVRYLLSGTRTLDYLIANVGRRTESARTYIPPGMSVLGFFAALEEQRITYVVLRWFESLPAVNEGEDLDLLIADVDYSRFREITDDSNKTGVPIDAYSESGLCPGDYEGHSYFPPDLTSRLITNRSRKKDTEIWVPSGRDHFDSMLYHAVFHKGARLWSSVGQTLEAKEPEHDYFNELEKIGKKEGVEVSLGNMLEVGRYFQNNGMIPSPEAINLLVRCNSTLVNMLEDLGEVSSDSGHLLCFVLREEANFRLANRKVPKNKKGGSEVPNFLRTIHGLEIIGIYAIPETRKEFFRRNLRGGNWDKGPYATSGGPPSELIFAFDFAPIPPSLSTRTKFPSISNERIQLKKEVRNALNLLARPWLSANTIHSADNEREAHNIASLVGDPFAEQIRALVVSRKQEAESQWTRVELLSHGRRSRVDIIEFEGKLCVEKFFKPGNERYLEREIFALETLSKTIKIIPNLLAKTDRSVVMPLVRDALPALANRERLKALRRRGGGDEVLSLLRSLYELGYAAIGMHPGNFLLDENGKWFAVDFEHLYQYPAGKIPLSFEKSYDIAGIPPGFDGDIPSNFPNGIGGWAAVWSDALGPSSKWVLSG